MKYIFSFLITSLFLFNACSSSADQSIQNTLKLAGKNRSELLKVLEHYQTADDSLKYKAALYLINNMPGHGFVDYSLLDSAGNKVDLNVLNYPDYKTMVAAWDSIEAIHGPIDYRHSALLEDAQTVTASFLINNIDLAFNAWHEKPWARHLNFDQFCEFVLPYRGSNEPLDTSRAYFLKKYADLPAKMKNPSDPVEAARLINEDIKTWFVFDDRYYRHPTDQGVREMLKSGRGRCEDMANLAIYAMRANGLAVTSDYTPHWADTGNNHAWNALLDSTGKAVPFMGALYNPGSYAITNRVAKVYRKTYSEQPDNLAFKIKNRRNIPGWLAGKYYTDVTRDYTKTATISVPLDSLPADSVHYAYLCVFNGGKWKAIHWGAIHKQSAQFTDMGVNIAYLPMFYLSHTLKPAGKPVILQKDGTVRLLAARNIKQTLRLFSTTRRTQREATDSIKKTAFVPNVNYELFYWDFGWQSLGVKHTISNQPLIFTYAPQGTLYWLVQKDYNKQERIFTYETNQQVWW